MSAFIISSRWKGALFHELCAIAALTCVPVFSGNSTAAGDTAFSTSFQISDAQILVGDWVGYKLTIKNKLASAIQIRNVKSGPDIGVVRFLECRVEGKEWVVVREESLRQQGVFEGDVEIAGHESFAYFGQFFLTSRRDFVFSTPGKYEIRIRLNCLLGENISEPRTVIVRERPADDLMKLRASSALAEVVLASIVRLPWSEKHERLTASLSGGSVRQSLTQLSVFERYRHSGKIKEEATPIWEAYQYLSKGVDSVRNDMITVEFVRLAHEHKDWDALERLLMKLKEDSHFRRTFLHELEKAKKRLGSTP